MEENDLMEAPTGEEDTKKKEYNLINTECNIMVIFALGFIKGPRNPPPPW